MSRTTIGVAAAAALAAGALALGGAALANAATSASSSSSGGSSSSSNGSGGAPNQSRPENGSASGAQGGARGGSNDTPVTGDELTTVKAAVTAKDSSVTVTTVRKDPDGSYDVLGTKAGANVMLEVSADLATITTHTGGPGGGPGGPGGPGGGPGGPGGGKGGSNDTPVTGDELTTVKAAVTAKDSTVTVTTVRKDPDGSYDVLGTKAGAKVMLEVSADLATITTHTGGPGAGHGPNGQAPNGQAPNGQAPNGRAPSTSSGATSSSSTGAASASQV